MLPRTFEFGPDDVSLCLTSLDFDLSVFDIFGLLGVGGGLYIADALEQRDPEMLLDILLSQPITFWNSVPGTLNQLFPLLPQVAGEAGTENLRLVYLSGDYTPLTLPGPGSRCLSACRDCQPRRSDRSRRSGPTSSGSVRSTRSGAASPTGVPSTTHATTPARRES